MTTMSNDPASARTCASARFGVVPQCSGAASWDVVASADDGTEVYRHPGCMTHSLAEMDARLADNPALRIDIIYTGG